MNNQSLWPVQTLATDIGQHPIHIIGAGQSVGQAKNAPINLKAGKLWWWECPKCKELMKKVPEQLRIKFE